MAKRSSLGSAVTKRLSDITNSQQRPQSACQSENPQPASSTTREQIDNILKENMGLLRLLAEKNKTIELSGIELQKLRINMQKLQQQNSYLAQANSQMLAELNFGKDKVKAMRHELGCKVSLLTAKNFELQEKEENRTRQSTSTKEEATKCEKASGNSSQSNFDTIDSSAAVAQQGTQKEKVDNKRICLRRQSGRFKSEQPEPTEDMFEREDKKFPIHPVHNQMLEASSHSVESFSGKAEKEGKSAPKWGAQELRRSSIGRPLRKAAEKVQTYKEMPLNVKLRKSVLSGNNQPLPFFK